MFRQQMIKQLPAKTLILLCSVCLASVASALAQEERNRAPADWLVAVRQAETELQTGIVSRDERREMLRRLNGLRAEVRAWLRAHPEANIENNLEQNSANDLQIDLDSSAAVRELTLAAGRLRQTIEEIAREAPNSPFTLGRIEVVVNAAAPLEIAAGTTTTIDQSELQRTNRKTVADALNLLPGIALTRIGPRNERAVYVRGFDVDQVPVLIDGIPVYVPYDGYLDLDRFTAFDLSEVRVSKGFASPIYGANTIGGAINLITRRPQRKLEGSAGIGAASGDTYDAFLNLGTKFRQFYLQGSGSFLQSRRFPLSDDFRPTRFQPAAEFRLNSDRRDQKINLKAGYAPSERSEYSFTYINQRSEKGNPPYAGVDPRITRPRYWRWNYWDKESFYFVSNTDLGAASYLRVRAFYDKFNNQLTSYDDARYATVTRPFAFRSIYDDDAAGGSFEFGTNRFERQQIKASFHYKRDTHQENNVGEPVRTFKDRIVSVGVEDAVRVFDNLSIVVGFSVDALDVRRAQDFRGGLISEFPLDAAGATTLNPQIGVFYSPTENGRLRFAFARKSRLPTIKDRYSYRLGQAVPNPCLRAERANNFEAGYGQSFDVWGISSFAEAAVFYSDITDLVQRFTFSPQIFQLRNIPRARHAGAEFSLRSQFANRVDANLNYTYLDRKNKTEPFSILTETPRHKLFGALGYQPINRLRLQGIVQFEDGRHNLNEPGATVRLSQFTTVDVSATYFFPGGVEAQGGASNLFDRNYQLFEGYPEAGRTFFLNLRYRF